jgi:hypothetical protein
MCPVWNPILFVDGSMSRSSFRRDVSWFSAVDLALIRYLSQTSDIRLWSRIQKTTFLFPTGGRTAIGSGRRIPYRVLCEIPVLSVGPRFRMVFHSISSGDISLPRCTRMEILFLSVLIFRSKGSVSCMNPRTTRVKLSDDKDAEILLYNMSSFTITVFFFFETVLTTVTVAIPWPQWKSPDPCPFTRYWWSLPPPLQLPPSLHQPLRVSSGALLRSPPSPVLLILKKKIFGLVSISWCDKVNC